MPRILFVTQEKGGVGKTVFARALAEAVVSARIIEVDSSSRLIELGDRVTFFKMRADREAIERSGGKAARAEFDSVLAALEKTDTSTIVDIGANTSMTLLAVIEEIAPVLALSGFEFGVCVVVTTEHAALASASSILAASKSWTSAQFMIENRVHESVDQDWLKKHSKGVTTTFFEQQILEKGADEILQTAGLASISQIDPALLRAKYGIGPASRILKDLERFRKEAMDAVRPAAEWLIG